MNDYMLTAHSGEGFRRGLIAEPPPLLAQSLRSEQTVARSRSAITHANQQPISARRRRRTTPLRTRKLQADFIRAAVGC
jgi:hypothetical protein